NDDPCDERRTILEGMPRLPREAWESGLRRAVLNPRSLWRRGTENGKHGPGPEIPRGAPKGERASRLVTQDASPQTGSPVCAYRTRPRGTCGAQRTQGGLFCSGLFVRWGVCPPVTSAFTRVC